MILTTIIQSPLFYSHETAKTLLESPVSTAAIIYAFIFAAIIAAAGKANYATYLDNAQTSQLKGLAIVLVITGHINHIIPEFGSFPYFSDIGVAIFLFCSGYGLISSSMTRKFTVKGFITRRFLKIMVPYWVITPMVLIADSLLLNKHYSPLDIVSTFMGINVTEQTKHIDYVRWFITYIMLMYGIFIVSMISSARWSLRLGVLWGSIVIMDALLLLFHVNGSSMYVTYSFMFPLGCSVALKKNDIQKMLPVNKRLFAGMWTISLPFIFMAINIIVTNYYLSITSSFLHFITRQVSFVSCIMLLLWAVSALYNMNVSSMLLSSLGDISYELYLIHAIFLVKYDFLLFRKPFVIYFIVYLLFITALSYMLKHYLWGRRYRIGI